jgi:hypothetical protein
MAGIQALVNQKTHSRWGNPNPTYYSLANTEYGANGSTSCNSALGPSVSAACIFYDVTEGDNDVACKAKKGVYTDCYHRDKKVGILSTSDTADKPAYRSKVGWDFATGIGSVNAFNLVMNWPTGAKP